MMSITGENHDLCVGGKFVYGCPDLKSGIYFIWAFGLGGSVLDSVHEILRAT